MDNYTLKKIFKEIEAANDLAGKEIFAVRCQSRLTNTRLYLESEYIDGEFSTYKQFAKYIQTEYSSDFARIISTAKYRRFANTFVHVDLKGLAVQLRLIRKF